MAAARQLLEIFRSHFEGDNDRFRTAMLQIAAGEARKGHAKMAEEIQKLATRARPARSQLDKAQTTNSVPFGRPPEELAGLLEMVTPSVGLRSMVLPPPLRQRLDRVLREQLHFARLREHGLQPRRRLLLLGPPGTGKTMTAHALAHDLGLPLFIVRMDALFTKFLGETASKLRLVFDAVEQQRAVFLFDEFDSLGLARGSQHDVAEMRRVLNSFLVFLDQMRGHSLVVAASNHPEALDTALFRRFDDVLTYQRPTREELQKVLQHRLAGQATPDTLDWDALLSAADSLSFAEATQAADDAAKTRLIEDLPALTTDMLLEALKERRQALPPAQKVPSRRAPQSKRIR